MFFSHLTQILRTRSATRATIKQVCSHHTQNLRTTWSTLMFFFCVVKAHGLKIAARNNLAPCFLLFVSHLKQRCWFRVKRSTKAISVRNSRSKITDLLWQYRYKRHPWLCASWWHRRFWVRCVANEIIWCSYYRMVRLVDASIMALTEQSHLDDDEYFGLHKKQTKNH